MNSLREKINNLDTQNLQNSDTLYSILAEMADRIEKLEGNSPKTTRKHDVDYYMSKIYFDKVKCAIFNQDEITRFIKRIIEDRE